MVSHATVATGMDSKKEIDAPGGHQWLEACGFNLRAVLDINSFGTDLARAWSDSGVSAERHERLVLLGMGGSLLWNHLQQAGAQGENIFDSFSKEAVATVCSRFWGDQAARFLYPGEALIPLQQLGRWAGWSTPSPLGLDISPIFGPWFAFRAAFLTSAPLPFSERVPAVAPCGVCETKPCVDACPAQAVQADATLNLGDCLAQRFDDPLGCGMRCAARLACPVGASWRYSPEHLDYHGARSLEVLNRWGRARR